MQVVNTLLAQGLSHEEIYQTALKAGIDHQQVCKQLAFVADARLVERHRSAIRMLAGYLGLLSLGSIGALLWVGVETQEMLYYACAGIALLMTLAFLFALKKNRAQAYTSIVMLTLLGSFQGMRHMQESPGVIMACVLLNLILVGLALRLKYKLFPRQNFLHTKKQPDGCLVF